MKPLEKVKIEWSPEFAYAIGLLATDGNLSSNGRMINLTSKDEEQLINFKKCLKLHNKIGNIFSGAGNKALRVQFGDVKFYKFLNSIGLTSNKSKNIGALKISEEYFFDFLRGHFDGDGTFYSYWDKRWKHSFMFYTEFISASKKHIDWLQSMIGNFLHIKGHITKSKNNVCYQLKYAKKDSIKLLGKIYHDKNAIFLSRKYLKIKNVFATIGITF